MLTEVYLISEAILSWFYSEGMGLWIKEGLQNHFRLKFEMEFGILGWDDELDEFLGWERKVGFIDEYRASVYWHLHSGLIKDEIKIAIKYIKIQLF